MTLNGLILLLWVIGLAICYGIGYLHGKANEAEKTTKNINVLNDKIREILK